MANEPSRYRSSNPAFTRGAGFERLQTPSASDLEALYQAPPRMTVDDVIMHTVGLMALLGVSAGVGWWLAPSSYGLVATSGLTAFALSLFIAFSRTTRPVLICVFAVLEGLLVGGVSRAYETRYSGIVLQALLGTAVVFVGMLLAYRSGRLRATPRMRKVVFGTLMGWVALGLIDFALRGSGAGHVPIMNDASPVGILVSAGIVVIAALQFILDFDYIEQAVRIGVPRREAWRASYGLLIGFVWVYLELLRLLGKLRQ